MRPERQRLLSSCVRAMALFMTALAATGCIRSGQVLEEVRTGQTRGTYVSEVPFEKRNPGDCGSAALSSLLTYWGKPTTQDDIARGGCRPERNGVPGFDLWRCARRAGFVSVEAPGLETSTIDRLLEQGVPVLLNLGSGFNDGQDYVLVVGHDLDRKLWILQDGEMPDRVVSEEWLSGRRASTNGWGLVIFPLQYPVVSLGGRLHLLAADRAEELRQPREALRHLEEACVEYGQDSLLWFRIGGLQRLIGRPEEAEKAYREALRLDPENPEAMNNLALLLSEIPWRLDEAEVAAQSSVSACSRSENGIRRLPYALDTLGLIAQRRNRPEVAKDAFEAALLAIPPSFPAEMRADLEREIRRHRDAP